MQYFENLHTEPRLTSIEELLFRLVINLDIAQLQHRFFDKDAPRFPNVWKLLFIHRKAVHLWEDEVDRYYSAGTLRKPEFPLPLFELWNRIDAPPDVTSNCAEDNDIFFDKFFISQRFFHSADGEVSYMVAGPLSNDEFRCIAYDCYGHSLCTTTAKSNCDPPPEDDLLEIEIQTKFSQGGTNIRKAFVPECYGKFELLAIERTQGKSTDHPD